MEHDLGIPSSVPHSGAKHKPNPALMYLARLAPGSRRAQAQALRTLAGWLGGDPLGYPWATLSPGLASGLRARAAREYAPATARRHMAALRGVVQEAWRAGGMTAEVRDRILALPPVRGSRPPAGRALERGELTALYKVASGRDRALLGVLVFGGLRVAEAASLCMQEPCQNVEPSEDFSEGSSILTQNPVTYRNYRGTQPVKQTHNAQVRGIVEESRQFRQSGGRGHLGQNTMGGGMTSSPPLYKRGGEEVMPLHGPERPGEKISIQLVVAGKGARGRVVVLAGAPARDVLDWNTVRTTRTLFGLTDSGIRRALTRLCDQAGVRRCSPHDLRRTYASAALEAGVDIATVQQAMGHADPRTTSRYDRRGEAAQQNAAAALASLAALVYDRTGGNDG